MRIYLDANPRRKWTSATHIGKTPTSCNVNNSKSLPLGLNNCCVKQVTSTLNLVKDLDTTYATVADSLSLRWRAHLVLTCLLPYLGTLPPPNIPGLLRACTAATEFVDFEDSRGLFSCRIPKNFLRTERAKDKRGTVFVAGDYSKAEVLSVQVVKAFDLLTDAGERRSVSRSFLVCILA